MKTEIESINHELDSINYNIIYRLDNVEFNMSELKEKKEHILFNIQAKKNHAQEINKILVVLEKIINDTDTMKNFINGKIEENKEEIEKLMKELDKLKERIKKLQHLIVCRKIIKIILKIIIINCFDSYNIMKENKKYHIVNVKLKEEKYKNMINVVNSIIDSIYQANTINHIEGAINKIIDILNVNTTYGDLLNICQKILAKK